MKKEVVTNFLLHEGKILILKRTLEHEYGKGKWCAITGFIERDETPYQASIREILEEVLINSEDLKLIKKGDTIEVPEEKENIIWIVHPFLFKIKSDKVKLGREHKEYKWIKPEEINKFNYVVGLDKSMKAVDLL